MVPSSPFTCALHSKFLVPSGALNVAGANSAEHIEADSVNLDAAKAVTGPKAKKKMQQHQQQQQQQSQGDTVTNIAL
jgi:hypothetical protein